MKKKTGNRGAVMTELKTLALLSGGLLLGNMGGKRIFPVQLVLHPQILPVLHHSFSPTSCWTERKFA